MLVLFYGVRFSSFFSRFPCLNFRLIGSHGPVMRPLVASGQFEPYPHTSPSYVVIKPSTVMAATVMVVTVTVRNFMNGCRLSRFV